MAVQRYVRQSSQIKKIKISAVVKKVIDHSPVKDHDRLAYGLVRRNFLAYLDQNIDKKNSREAIQTQVSAAAGRYRIELSEVKARAIACELRNPLSTTIKNLPRELRRELEGRTVALQADPYVPRSVKRQGLSLRGRALKIATTNLPKDQAHLGAQLAGQGQTGRLRA